LGAEYLSEVCSSVLSVYLLYWYKSTDTDACGEGGAEYLSEVYTSAVSGGCWLLSDMEGPLAEVESERYKREREVVKSVMQKEAQVCLYSGFIKAV
jgi:hypothetical protein